jgi:hypothetical protein
MRLERHFSAHGLAPRIFELHGDQIRCARAIARLDPGKRLVERMRGRGADCR